MSLEIAATTYRAVRERIRAQDPELDEQTLAELKDQERIIFRYVTPSGEVTADANPNGSIENIAGICNAGRNVLGMMPHPERASEPELGMTDGVKLFDSLVSALVAK